MKKIINGYGGHPIAPITTLKKRDDTTYYVV